MSSSSTGGIFTTVAFNPALLSKDDLIRGFTGRHDLLQHLLDDLRRTQAGTAPQHQLVIGQRGLGKTTLLRRLAFAIEDDSQLSSVWLPLVFPEEQYNVRHLADFWLNCVDAFSDALDFRGDKAAADNLDRRVESIPADPVLRSAAALGVLMGEADRLCRSLVLLVDNIDIVLDRIRDEEWEFRRVISSEHRIYLIGASSRAIETLYEHGRAFYDFFQPHDLKGLNDPEMFSLLTKLAKEAGDERVQQTLRDNPARLRALRVLTGGNPRTLVLLYRILSDGPGGDVQRDIEQLLDMYTPLYKARFEDLPTQAQQVVDVMAIQWDPATAADLAEKLKPLEVNQISAQLTRLEDYGVIEKTPWYGESKAAFQISERFFNIWYLMRSSRRVRRRLIWLVRFLEAWFERDQLTNHAKEFLLRDPAAVGLSRFAETSLAYAQLIDDRSLRRSLESAGLHAALDPSLRDQLDFSDLPPELKDRKERMEKLRDLRSGVLALNIEGINSTQLWDVLGGSLLYTLEHKLSFLNVLLGLGSSGASEFLALWRRAEPDLEADNPFEAALLRKSLREGAITDAYDVEGLLDVAHRHSLHSLPILALTAKSSFWDEAQAFLPGELEIARSALLKLSTEPDFAAEASYYLGVLYRDAYKNFVEAQRFFLQATAKDSAMARAWRDLGRLQFDQLREREAAEHSFRRGIELNPDNVRLRAFLGLVLATSLDRQAEAEQSLRKALELEPQDVQSQMGLAIVFFSSGRVTEAERLFRKAIEMTQTGPYLGFLWEGLAMSIGLDQDRKAEALAAAMKAVDSGSARKENRSRALNFARSLGTESDKGRSEALDAVKRLHDSVPEESEAKFVLAGLLALAGDWPAAKRLLAELLAQQANQLDLWALDQIVKSGHLDELLKLLEETEGWELWRPTYEALRAIQAGSRQYLRRIAPEVRTIAEQILSQIAPEIPESNQHRKASVKRKSKRKRI